MRSFLPTDSEAYRALARGWAATVGVVTVRRRPEGVGPGAPELDGFTATAFLMVSIDPPLILVSANNLSSAAAMLRDADFFALNVLGSEQVEVAGAFAQPQTERGPLWSEIHWLADSQGVPLLPGALGAFSARRGQLVEAGDHTLVLGEVHAIHHGEGRETLLYANRQYVRTVPL